METLMASNDRYVQPGTGGGWDVVKDGHRRATAHAETKEKAIARARELTRRDGGGEVRVMNGTGKIVDSRTVGRRPALTTARRRKRATPAG
jgi:hypothetical protein